MAIVETLAALGGAAQMLAGRSAKRKLRRSERKQLGIHMRGLEAGKAQLEDIQRRQDLALGDANIGLEGEAMVAKQRNLDRDQAFDMGEIERRLALAREGRRNVGALNQLESQQDLASIIGGSALGLKGLMPSGVGNLAQDVNEQASGLPYLPGVSHTGLLSQLAQMLYKKRTE